MTKISTILIEYENILQNPTNCNVEDFNVDESLDQLLNKLSQEPSDCVVKNLIKIISA